jgi:hypothetical protein
MDIHIDEVLNLPLVDVAAVKAAQFKVVDMNLEELSSLNYWN